GQRSIGAPADLPSQFACDDLGPMGPIEASRYGDPMLLVGLTGGIGSGKSTVSAALADLGAVVIDADAIVHELQSPGQVVLAEMVELMGPGILHPDGTLDRQAVADVVFH